MVFLEQQAKGLAVWRQDFTHFRVPKIFNLRSDPFEEAEDNTLFYDKWTADHVFIQVPHACLSHVLGRVQKNYKKRGNLLLGANRKREVV